MILPSVAVPGYPRELEAIVLTAMANDPNARFQNAAEMIEALDAFAQRAKLVGSNTSMGRFMVQLFGSKKEPWVEGADSPDRTQITETSSDGADSDNEKTLVVEDSRAQRQLAQQPLPDAAAWQGGDARRPAMPFEQRTPPQGHPARMPTPPSFDGQPISEVGARPLIDDRLGWSTNVNQRMPMQQGGSTRLATTPGMGPNFKIRSNRGWIVLAVLVLAGLATGLVLAWQGYI